MKCDRVRRMLAELFERQTAHAAIPAVSDPCAQR
jgi:hypothetical protein